MWCLAIGHHDGHKDALTEQQLGILLWIAKGCPPGVMTDHFHRISAAALRRRGLVKVSGRGPTWKAVVTAEGRQYLAHADSDDPPVRRQANVSVTQQLVDDVMAAGGSLRVPRRGYYDREGVDYERRAELAQAHGKVPPGMALNVAAVSATELQIDLVDAFGGLARELAAVPVPAKVSRYHPVVRRLRESTDRHEVSRAAMPRALRLLQTLVEEAERRGYKVASVDTEIKRAGQGGWSGSKDGHLSIGIGEDWEAVRVHEEGLPSRSGWEGKHSKWSGSRLIAPPFSEYEADATGRLSFSIVSGWDRRGRSASWADRQTWTLDEKLPELLREVEARAGEAEERRQEAARRQEERHRQWEAAMDRAKGRFVEHLRAEALTAQVKRWQTVGEIRAFCNAAEQRFPDGESGDWLAWARAYADQQDPLREPPAAPAIPEEIRPDDLRPFLSDWSPYGPDRKR